MCEMLNMACFMAEWLQKSIPLMKLNIKMNCIDSKEIYWIESKISGINAK